MRIQAAQQAIPEAWTLTACQAMSQVLGVGDTTTDCPTELSLLLPPAPLTAAPPPPGRLLGRVAQGRGCCGLRTSGFSSQLWSLW